MILYTLSIRFYILAVRIASLFNDKARLMIKGRKDLLANIKAEIRDNDKDIIWMHVSSLGEFEQGRPVLEKIKEQYPQYKILVTFFSPSGYEIRKDYEGADYVFYIPFDTSTNAKCFIEIVNPKKVFFVKYDYWYFFLKELKKKKIETYIFSTIFSEKQAFFKCYGALWRKMLTTFKTIFVQNEESVKLLSTIGITNCEIAGDTRFDRVYDISKRAKHLPLIEEFSKGKKVFVCGSTWAKDEDNIIEYMREENLDIKWIIAPHETNKSHVEEIVKKLGGKCLKYSAANEENINTNNVLLIDSIGILSSIYQYGSYSYIGGGFGAGIHNTQEAATFGLPIVFGSNYKRFKEAVDMVELQAAFTYSEYSELKIILDNLIKDEKYRASSAKKAKAYVKSQIGASKKIVEASFIGEQN